MTPANVRSVTVLLEVFDLPTSLAFYRALGCEVLAHWDGEREDEWDWVLLRLGDAQLMLNTADERDERPAQRDPARIKSHSDTELFFECVDLDAVCEEIRRNGIELPAVETTSYGTRRVRLTDPDGSVFGSRPDVQEHGGRRNKLPSGDVIHLVPPARFSSSTADVWGGDSCVPRRGRC